MKKISRIQGGSTDSLPHDKERWDSALVEADCLSAEVREIRKTSLMLENEQVPTAAYIYQITVAMSIRNIGIALYNNGLNSCLLPWNLSRGRLRMPRHLQ